MSSKVVKEQEPFSQQALLDEIHALQAENRALKDEVQSLKTSLEEAEELKRAISEGDLDALILPGQEGELVFTLDSADRAYRTLVETMNEGTATLGFDSTILFCNRCFSELVKMPLNDITGTSFYRFIAPEDEATFKALLEHKASSCEVRILAAGEKSLTVNLSISPLKIEGSPNAWCLVVTDLTEQKKNEEIVASERLARSVIEQVAEAIVVCDASGKIIRLSDSTFSFFGSIPVFGLFEDLVNLRVLEKADEGESIFPVSLALKGVTIFGEEVVFESKNRQSRLYLLLNSRPLKGDDGEIIGCVMTLTDITKLKKTEEALQQAYEELEAQTGELQVQTEELRITNEALNKSEKRFELLSEANALLLSSNDPEATIQTVAEKVMCHLNCDVFFNYAFDEVRGRLHLNAYAGISAEAAKEIEWLDKEDETTICGCIARDGCRIIAENLQHNRDQWADLVQSILIQTYVCQPVRIREKAIGTLSFGTRSRKSFAKDELALMSTVADQVSVAIERKWAEEAQRENSRKIAEAVEAERKRLFDMLETLPVMVCLMTPDYHVAFANRAFRDKFGESNGRHCYEYCCGFKEPCEFCQSFKPLETGQPHHWEFTSPDGSTIIDAYDFPFTDVDGSPMILEMDIDITDRKRAEEALGESEERFRVAQELSPNGFTILRPVRDALGEIIDFTWVYENAAVAEMNGTDPEAVVGKRLLELFPGHRCTTFLKVYQQVVQTGEPCIFEDVYGGESLPKRTWFRTTVVPTGGDIAILAEDITERKQAEEALIKAKVTLEETVKERTAELEEAYNSLLENQVRLNEAQEIAHLGNWDWNLLTDKKYWSNEIYRIFGLDPMEFDGSYEAFLSRVDPEDRRNVDNAVKKAFNGETYSTEYRIVLPDGERRTVYSQGEVIFDEKHAPVRMKGVLQDISERKKVEEALEKIEKIRIKEIHHRIKNNLQVISSLLDLQAEKFEDEKVVESFKEGQNRVISMALIHEELYKGEGTDKLDFSIYLKKLAENLFKTYSLFSKNIRLNVDLEESAFIDMDTAIPLGIIVNELITNSLKHAFTEVEEGEIRIRFCKDVVANDDLQKSIFNLTISDDGKGIQEDLDLENVESLGLQLVSILVEQLDGQIELNHTQGTEFWITFEAAEK